MKFLLSLLLLLQSVRMTEDFLPLDAGNRWVYDVTSESGQKLGQLEFSVSDRSIVAGRSVYAVSGFPFGGESPDPVRLIRYDRDSRQFVRISGELETPLFPGDAQSTEVLQSDSSGIPQKFALRTGSTTLVFQRGVGVIEARLQTSDGIHIAKIASSSIGRNSGPQLQASAAAPASRSAVTTVAPVTAENPVLKVSSEAQATGMKLELMIANTSDKLLPFKFNTSRSYDFVITDPATDREIWRWSQGRMFSQVIRSDSIRGGSKWTYSEIWNRRDNDSNPVPPGRYRLVGILTSQPPIQSAPVTIDVQ